MTPEEQRIAIAEACGWINIVTGIYGHITGVHEDDDDDSPFSSIPDYLNDLNAMRDAVLSQNYQFRSEFTNAMKIESQALGVLLCELKPEDWANIFLRIKRK